jgi:hypothetical protein
VSTNDKTLGPLIRESWFQYIATQANHKTMHDLVGLDSYLTTTVANTFVSLATRGVYQCE